MIELTLFGEVERVEPAPVEKLSADRRRTLKQREMIAAGLHPLTGRRAHPEDGTCGDCAFREVLQHHNRSYPKCTRYDHRLSHGASTDCRAWWPACHDFELGDNLSPDAMRGRP